VVAVRWKIVAIILAVGLVGAGVFALREASHEKASARGPGPAETVVGSANGLGVSIKLTDYGTDHQLACGGTYAIQTWVSAKVMASAQTAGLARLVYVTNENGVKYWHAKAFTVNLAQGDAQVIGRTDQWTDADGGAATYSFRVELYRLTDQEHFPQASTTCNVTVSKAE
jgi:hypothetical protein